MHMFRLVGLALMGCAWAHPFTKCAGVNDQLGVTAVALNPDPPVHGKSEAFELDGTSTIAVTGGTATAIVTVSGKVVDTLKLDLCTQLGVKCPIAAKAAWKATFSYDIPKVAPPGTDANVQITVTDKSGAKLSCISIDIKITEPEVLKSRYLNDTAPQNTCGGNCPSNDCSSCPCGTTPNRLSVSEWCGKYSGWNQGQCQCIMSHESGGNANAVNQNSGGSLDVGLWQVNTQNWNSCSGGKPPCDPNTNLQCAIKVFGWGGNTFKLWSTCHACNAC